ncbi:hypothetical protein [Paenibacillus koleovorans]|nr:hypothetical protein [Paenibacillus koleovorans]
MAGWEPAESRVAMTLLAEIRHELAVHGWPLHRSYDKFRKNLASQ